MGCEPLTLSLQSVSRAAGALFIVPFPVETVSVTQLLTTVAGIVRSNLHVCLVLFLCFAFELYCIIFPVE